MKRKQIVKYSPWDSDTGSYMWRYWVAYDLKQESWAKVTTLNRIKNFLSDYFSIQKPTLNLVNGILSETESWKPLWEWTDFYGNICKFFFVEVDKFKASVSSLLDTWKLRRKYDESYAK